MSRKIHEYLTIERWEAYKEERGNTGAYCYTIPDYRFERIFQEIAIAVNEASKVTQDTSDGYHTFRELYHHRLVLTIALFNTVPDQCIKSLKHSDGSMFENYFIVGLQTPEGIASYHYPIEHFDKFKCREVDFFPVWDNHTSEDAINRIGNFFRNKV